MVRTSRHITLSTVIESTQTFIASNKNSSSCYTEALELVKSSYNYVKDVNNVNAELDKEKAIILCARWRGHAVVFAIIGDTALKFNRGKREL